MSTTEAIQLTISASENQHAIDKGGIVLPMVQIESTWKRLPLYPGDALDIVTEEAPDRIITCFISRRHGEMVGHFDDYRLDDPDHWSALIVSATSDAVRLYPARAAACGCWLNRGGERIDYCATHGEEAIAESREYESLSRQTPYDNDPRREQEQVYREVTS